VSEKELKVLIFSINNESYATDIMQVERILGYQEPTVIPDSPDFIKGVINHEGRILPVVSLAKKFHLKETLISQDAKIIVTKQLNFRAGIIVDFVSEVLVVKTEDIEASPEIISGISKRYIKGLIKKNEEIIIFLDLETIFTEEEKKLI